MLRNPHCELCELHTGANHVCLLGNGPARADVMLIGEAPGANEDEQGVPFIGQAGALLNESLSRFAKLSRDDCYVTNVVKCRPPSNRKPTKTELQICADAYLDREILRTRPKFMLVMGNSGLQGVLGKSGIMKHHGQTVTMEWGTEKPIRVKVMPTIHPAAVLRNPKWGADFVADMVRFGQLVRGSLKSPKTRIKIVSTPKQLEWLRGKLNTAKVISWDVETYTDPAKKPYVHTNFQYWHGDESHIVSIAFSWEEGVAVCVPLWHEASPFYNKHRARLVLSYLRHALERKDCVYIAHNGKFDAAWMKAFGVNVPQSFDTMLASHILEENREKGLKSLSQKMLDADAYDVGEELKAPHSVPVRRLAVYNGKDADYTLRLAKIFRHELTENPRSARLFTKLLMPASRTLLDVENLGVCIDPERWRERHDQAQENVEKLYAYIDRQVPKSLKPINLKSPQQVAKWLYEHLEIEPTKRTKTGAPSTGESAITRLQKDYPAVRGLLLFRKWSKYLDTYLLPWWFQHRDANGRIRNSYKISGTVTGRLSGQGGIQQIPRDPFMRSIICTEDGWKLASADYSQIELRIAAMLANEERMLRQFTAKEDIHRLRAARITGKRPEDVTKEERFRAKAVSFGFLYGMGAKNFVDYAYEEYNVEYTEQEAQAVRRGFFSDYSAFLPWHARQRRLAQRYHEVSSPMGRVRHLPDILSNDEKVRGEAERQAINSPVQVMASDIMLFSLIELHRILPPKEARIVFTIHDSIGFEIRDGYVNTWLPVIQEVMEDTHRVERQFKCEINVPITVDIEIGTHFGEGKDWKR